VQLLERRIALSNVTDDQVRIWFNDKTIKPELEQALRKIVQQKNQISGIDQQMQSKQSQINSINQDQQRLRENMKALKGSAEEKTLLQRYTRELNDQEDKLQSTRTDLENLSAQRAAGQKQLDQMLQELSLDESL